MKNKMAISNGYNMIRIYQRIVWDEKENWGEQLIELLIDLSFQTKEKKLYTIGSVYEKTMELL